MTPILQTMSGNDRGAGPRPGRLSALLTSLVVASLLAGCSLFQPSPSGSAGPGPSTAGPSPSAAGATTASSKPTLAPIAPVRWTNCGRRFQCATLRLPRDYHDPAAGSLDVAIIRLPATDQSERIGSLIVNPGGPGGSGIELVRESASAFPSALRKQFDLVGFDPRGVNTSSPVRCIDDLDSVAALDPSPDNQKELDSLVDQAKAYAAACAKRNASLLPYLSTDAVVDDLDQIRQAVGDDKITYLGFSYGTLIGSMYADRYPDHIRAMVLDGALDPSLSEVQLRTGQAKAFEAELGRFLKSCAKRASCRFHEGGNSAKAFDALMAKIDKKSLPTPRVSDRRQVGPGLAFSAVLGSMYNKASWPSLEAGLALAKRGDGSILILLADPFRGRKPNGTYSNQSDAYFANTCLDFPVSTDVADYKKLSDTLRKVAPRLRAAAYNDLTCAFWSVPAQRTPAPAKGTGAPPIVVVGSTGDPATPYAWAKSLAKQLESAVLVTRKGEGHTAYLVSSCVQKAVDAYLLKLAVPKAGLVCKK
jgi:pimeloyl-ACP methyl ester carboxylesterase